MDPSAGAGACGRSADDPADDAEMRHACGVFACVAAGSWPTELNVPGVICTALAGLQHRGQESAGIVTAGGGKNGRMSVHKGTGLVNQVFMDDAVLRKLSGSNLGIGHVRYSTYGGTDTTNYQPFVVDTIHGLLAVAHNGELVNAKPLREQVLRRGVGLSTSSDSELITQTLSLSPPDGEPNGPDWPGRIRHLMEQMPTSYSLVIMHDDKIYGVRDPFGNRPLCIGRISAVLAVMAASGQCRRDGFTRASVQTPTDGWVLSSESCVFQSIAAELYREVLPGEIVELTKNGVRSLGIVPRPKADSPPAFCIFEYVYFARADSYFEGQMVYSVREHCGEQLAVEAAVDGADVVSTVPESATPAAFGFARRCGLPYVDVLSKNRYVGRTFIQPSNTLRQASVARKFAPLVENIRGRRIVLVDDSIVRGTTIKPLVGLLREAGAAEVHIRVASPPVRFPCYMGINIPTKEELVANTVDMDKLASHLGADSVRYLSVEGLRQAVCRGIDDAAQARREVGHCTACLTGEYPVKIDW